VSCAQTSVTVYAFGCGGGAGGGGGGGTGPGLRFCPTHPLVLFGQFALLPRKQPGVPPFFEAPLGGGEAQGLSAPQKPHVSQAAPAALHAAQHASAVAMACPPPMKTVFVLSFPYVCPEPVLVKMILSHLYIDETMAF
jgi:hypothetical protein